MTKSVVGPAFIVLAPFTVSTNLEGTQKLEKASKKTANYSVGPEENKL